MIRINVAIAVLLLAASGVDGAAFVSSSQASRKPSFVASARANFYHEPHFETLPLVVEKIPYNRMLDCAQQGTCTMQEMDDMIAGASCVVVFFVRKRMVGVNHETY